MVDQAARAENPSVLVWHAPLAGRLSRISSYDTELITTTVLGHLLAWNVLLVMLVLLLAGYSLDGLFDGSGRTIAWAVGGWIFFTLAGGAMLQQQVQAAFSFCYRRTQGELHSTALPVVIADESLSALVYAPAGASPLQRLNATAGRGIEAQLQRACRYYDVLLQVAQGQRLDALPPGAGSGWVGNCGVWLLVALILILSLTVSFAYYALFALPLIGMYRLTARLQRGARLTALSDFFNDQPKARWLQGWHVRVHRRASE